jgi:hypothetical protein
LPVGAYAKIAQKLSTKLYAAQTGFAAGLLADPNTGVWKRLCNDVISGDRKDVCSAVGELG